MLPSNNRVTSFFLQDAFSRRSLGFERVMAVVEAVAGRGGAAGEIFGAVPAPEPGEFVLGPLRLLAAVFFPFDSRLNAQHPGAFRFDVGHGQKRADVQPYAIVQVGFPADRLLVQRLPADEDVVGRLAVADQFQLLLQRHGGSDLFRRAVDFGCFVLFLPRDPVA